MEKLIVTFQQYFKDFNIDLKCIRKLIVINNPSNPITININGKGAFTITNEKTFFCNAIAFDLSLEIINVENVTLEIWK